MFSYQRLLWVKGTHFAELPKRMVTKEGKGGKGGRKEEEKGKRRTCFSLGVSFNFSSAVPKNLG